MSSEDQPTILRSSEWALAGSFFLILLSLFAIAKIQVWRYSIGTASAPVVLVQVSIEGFVEKPDIYEFPIGTPMEEILRKACPKRFANLRSIDLKSPLTTSLQLKLEPLRSLQVHVTGAVASAETIEVEPGTRICQLKQKIQLSDEADLAFFKKRKILSDGDVIYVPSKGNFKKP
jgi:hypothetical protein